MLAGWEGQGRICISTAFIIQGVGDEGVEDTIQLLSSYKGVGDEGAEDTIQLLSSYRGLGMEGQKIQFNCFHRTGVWGCGARVQDTI